MYIYIGIHTHTIYKTDGEDNQAPSKCEVEELGTRLCR